MGRATVRACWPPTASSIRVRSEEHTSELQSHSELVCRLPLEKTNPPAGPGPATEVRHERPAGEGVGKARGKKGAAAGELGDTSHSPSAGAALGMEGEQRPKCM